jgi:hypothetical protein
VCAGNMTSAEIGSWKNSAGLVPELSKSAGLAHPRVGAAPPSQTGWRWVVWVRIPESGRTVRPSRSNGVLPLASGSLDFPRGV